MIAVRRGGRKKRVRFPGVQAGKWGARVTPIQRGPIKSNAIVLSRFFLFVFIRRFLLFFHADRSISVALLHLCENCGGCF